MPSQDQYRGGYCPLQHLTHKSHGIRLQFRSAMFAYRVVRWRRDVGDLGHKDVEHEGDIRGAHVWTNLNPVDKPRELPAWYFASPTILTVQPDPSLYTIGNTVGYSRRAFVMKDEKWNEDFSLDHHIPSLPSAWPDIPGKTYGIIIDPTDTTKETPQWFHCDPRIIAPHRGGSPSMGSYICDVDQHGNVDLDRMAHSQTIFRVARPNPGCVSGFDGNTVALNFTTSGLDSLAGYGLFYDSAQAEVSSVPITGTPDAKSISVTKPLETPVNILGALSAEVSGPVHGGWVGDKHQLATTKDNERINAAHNDIDAYYSKRSAGFGDGPLAFEDMPPPKPISAGSVWLKTICRFNPVPTHSFVCGARQGRWEWYTKGNVYVPETPDQPYLYGKTARQQENYARARMVEPSPGGPSEGGDSARTGKGGKALGSAEPFAAVAQNLATPGQLSRPNPQWADAPNISGGVPADVDGFSEAKFVDQLQEHDQSAPITLRKEAFGEYDKAEHNKYTQRPGESRYIGGTAPGGENVTCPEVSFRDFQEFGYGDYPYRTSESYFNMGYGAHFSTGEIADNPANKLYNGYRWSWNGTYSELQFQRVNDGTANFVLDLCDDGSARFHEWLQIGGTSGPTVSGLADRFLLSTSLQLNGATGPLLTGSASQLAIDKSIDVTGGGEFSTGLCVGFAGSPSSDEVQVADADFKLDGGSINTPRLHFDSSAYLRYTRSSDVYLLRTSAGSVFEGEDGILRIIGEARVSEDNGGQANYNTFTGATENPTADPGWANSSTVDMTPPDGYFKFYVGAQAVSVPYWNT